MSEGNSNVGGGGIGFCGVLCIVFITLKLTDHIDWSWWWILSPMIIPLGLIAVFLVLLVFIGAFSGR